MTWESKDVKYLQAELKKVHEEFSITRNYLADSYNVRQTIRIERDQLVEDVKSLEYKLEIAKQEILKLLNERHDLESRLECIPNWIRRFFN